MYQMKPKSTLGYALPFHNDLYLRFSNDFCIAEPHSDQLSAKKAFNIFLF